MKADFAIADDLSAASVHDTIVKNFPGSILVIDNRGKIVYAYTSIEGLGMNSSEWVNQQMEDLIQAGMLDNSPSLRALKTKKVEFESNFLYGDPKWPITTISVPVVDRKSREIQYVIAYTLREQSIFNLLREIGSERERRKLMIQLFNKEGSTSDVITANPRMIALLKLLQRVAQSDSVIALHGETGSGKEVFARFTHKNSTRANKIFIPVNCAAIPNELMESELFGYEPGAFTGAKREGSPGLFELASDGTLFLDEIGELPLQMQSKLLRVLESGEYTKVGGKRVLKSHARLIVATNRNLLEMVEQKQFRADLYYRINVVSVTIPPLRERTEDIRPLVQHFVGHLNKKYGACKVCDEELLLAFERYS